MADAAAKIRLKAMTAWANEPTLSEQEIDALLDQYSLEDADGYTDADVEWTPTYNLRAAAKDGWTWKMGRCADLVSTDLDGDRMSSNQLFDHCQAMVRKYSGTAAPSMGYDVEADEFESFFSS